MTGPNIAFSRFKAGDLPGAEDAARAALTVEQSPAMLHLLGVLLGRRSAFAESAEILDQALALQPANPEIRFHLVRALIDSGRATEALSKAQVPAPGPAAERWWRLRAEAAGAAGALQDQKTALLHCDLAQTGRALNSNPGDQELMLLKGRLLGALQRSEEAETIYSELLRLDPANVEVIVELGQIYDRSGRLDDLSLLLASASPNDTRGSPLAYLRALAAWRRRALDEAASWLEKADPRRDPVRLLTLTARVEDARGNHGAAADAIAAKNKAVPDAGRWRQESAKLRSEMREFAATITPEWAKGFPPPRSGTRPPPAFLVGFPRSGTTLLDTFLMGHPEIAVLEEVPLMGFVTEALGPLQRMADIDDIEAQRLRDVYFEHLERHVAPGFAGLVVDKMPINTLCVPLIHRLFPDARIVFAQRHPADCVLSGLMQNFSMNRAMANFLDPADASDFYDIMLDVWTSSERLLPLVKHRVAYEQLVAKPEEELRALIRFLGLEWNVTVVDHRRSAQVRGRISTASYDQVGEALNARSVGRWRNYQHLLRPGLPGLLRWAEQLGYER